MKLQSAINAFLNQVYNSVAPPAKTEAGTSSASFYEAVIVRAVESEEFRERLMREPERVLAELNIELPPGVEVKFVANTDKVIHIAIPPFVGE